MPRKRTGDDTACYYDGKLLDRCTKADSDAYILVMNACGGEAARVLREYAYFSPELKAILSLIHIYEKRAQKNAPAQTKHKQQDMEL